MDSQADELVTLPDVAKRAGVGLPTLWSAIKEGLITPAPVRKRHNTQTFTREDAEFIITIALTAAAIGVAFSILMRIIKESGGGIDDGAIKIPLSSINT